tara:strand:- start:1065 stop:1682 length:618 start_codon:yes stop_codon:yes gene_type:complete
LPDEDYFANAITLNNMKKCRSAGYLDIFKYSSGTNALRDIMNTWVYDEQRLKDELVIVNDLWKNVIATESWCRPINDNVASLIVKARNYKSSQANQNVQKQQAWKELASSFKNLGESSKKAGEQALATANSMQMESSPVTSIHSKQINLNALPAPQGYQKTYVPTGTVGILQNTNFSGGSKICEYSNKQAIRVTVSQACPQLLKP